MSANVGTIRATLAIVVMVVVALGTSAALADGSPASGRRHVTKANKLAAKNKCRSAIVEFTKAYKLLKDPVLLFNRAECYRKIGKNTEALKDYEQFLADLPTTPNRKTVEEKIALLRPSVKTDTAVMTQPSPPEPIQPPVVKPDRRVEGLQATAAPRIDTWEDTAEPTKPSSSKIPPVAPPVLATEPPAANLTAQPQVPETQTTSAGHAWIWVGAAVVVAAAGAFAAYYFWPRPKTDVPTTPLGNYAF
jgi:tetratricopeptide (TPR) repeat protein